MVKNNLFSKYKVTKISFYTKSQVTISKEMRESNVRHQIIGWMDRIWERKIFLHAIIYCLCVHLHLYYLIYRVWRAFIKYKSYPCLKWCFVSVALALHRYTSIHDFFTSYGGIHGPYHIVIYKTADIASIQLPGLPCVLLGPLLECPSWYSVLGVTVTLHKSLRISHTRQLLHMYTHHIIIIFLHQSCT